MKNETKCLHSGYTPKNTEPRVVPIYQSTTFAFDSARDIGDVFDEPTKAVIYSRFANPTVMAVEAKIADLEGGVAAMCTSSGQAAALLAILNICNSGDSFICVSQVYGGTVNLFANTLKKLGIECIFVDCEASDDAVRAAFNQNTKAVFGETIANPALVVFDIERFAKIAHEQGVPLIVDNTFPTPILCKPIEFGADIVVHSTTKYMDGHALQCGGVIVDGGNFDWTNGKFPELVEPDPSYHGISYVKNYGRAAYMLKARMQLMRDFGAYPSAHSAFLLNLGLETLALRIERHSENAKKVAEYLQDSKKVESVKYPGLKGDRYEAMAKKYLKGASGVVTFVLNGDSDDDSKEKGMKFMDALKLVSRVVHVADIRSCVLHPASTTHRQCTNEQLARAGISPGLVRLSVGLENIDDIIEDIAQALEVL